MVRARDAAAILIVVLGVSTIAGGLGYLGGTIDGGNADFDEEIQTDPGTLAAETAIAELHDADISGENVSVGVLDVTGFETDSERLDRRVAAIRQFGGDGTSVGGNDHGTATAATVARVAPDVELYLGTFETPDDYAAGLEWMLENDVDVVVAPVSYAGSLGDGNSRLAKATTNATEQGLVVVAPAGNLGTGHWIGEYKPTDNVHNFDNGTLNEIQGPPGRAEFWLAWDDPTEEYTLELHRFDEPMDGTELLVRSVSHEGDHVPSERLTVDLGDDRYGLVVRGPENATGTTIRVASSSRVLSDHRPERSVTAPAAAPGAISVGAFDPVTGEAEPFSSRGPTADGRLGIYVLGPSSQPIDDDVFVGTSASAAFVGGVAALVLDVEPTLEPAEVRWIISASADPIDNVDAENGHGRIDPEGAVAEAIDRADGGDR